MRQLAIVLLVVSLLVLSGCGGSTKTVTPTAKPTKYEGFMDWKAGMWAETVTKSGGQTVKTRMELIENSPGLAKFQMVTDVEGQETIAQMWIDRKTDTVTKYIMKNGDQVLCMDASQFPSTSQPSEGDSYPADKPGITHGKYTTPTGKEVTVAKFAATGGEAWVSSEVPFGMVKLMQGEKTLMSLYDFGTIGARSRIDKEDVESCQDMGSAAAYTRETEYEPLYETSEESYNSQEHDYEQYYEEESSGADEDVNYEAYAIDRNTGNDVNFNCDDCQDMPAMARSACLASCR
ncbi:hypothetical protein KY359_03290 [Candidatus Woesearchaeota archaeon]|nr:hypothetical protein [Candidatus Woesearchaeota archaeon]